MRTTIDLDDQLRGQLLELAARRGLKGFSQLVHEAVQMWLRDQRDVNVAAVRAAALMGALSDGEADALQAAVGVAREGLVPRAMV